MNDSLLFATTPYAAAFIFAVGALTRLSLERQRRQLPPTVFAGRPVTTVALLGIIATHAAMWILPGGLLAWNQSVPRLIALELLLFALGIAAGIGVSLLVASSLREPARVPSKALANTQPKALANTSAAQSSAQSGAQVNARTADVAFLGVLLITIVSGVLIAARYRWASSWSAITLTPYVHSLFALEPDLRLVALPYLVKLHVFSGIVLVALLPLTSVMSLLLVPVHRLLDLLLTPIVTVTTRQAKRVGDWANESGRQLMWPDEEED